ncbi:hypothetical protein O3M35_007069 [Rhynocoris fuscipes]|uniref:Uncharacterized protein n=1 Tax=Rhynocoris fuscipes TaxID=488301 RepID=A0AAW1D9E4_9HEMI
MVISNKKQISYDTLNRKRVKYFSYEEDFYCNDGTQTTKNIDQIHGIYVLLGGLLLIASILILGYDLFLQSPDDGIRTNDYNRDHRNSERSRHFNTPASNHSNSPPVLAPMEYWLIQYDGQREVHVQLVISTAMNGL